MIDIKAIIFDFDGVLAESVNIKGDAFVALYADESPDIQQRVLAYHEAHGGVTRFDKIRYYEQELCGRAVSEKRVMQRADEFGVLVEQKVIASAWVKGAQNFLETHSNKAPFYIASATPEAELKRIIYERYMEKYFNGIYGAPVKKAEHILRVMAAHHLKPSDILMAGDAISDYEAAKTTKVNFIGRRLEGGNSPFPEGTTTIDDLTTLDQHIRLT